MNEFRCRTCKRQFLSKEPRCSAGSGHIVQLLKVGQVKVFPAQKGLMPQGLAKQAGPPGTPLTGKPASSIIAGLVTPVQATQAGVSAAGGACRGDWTEADRENNTQRWQDACLCNLNANNFRAYTRIIERRDFYRWFYDYTAELGYTTRWALAASIVATGAYEVAIMAPLSEDMGRMTGTVSNELQAMMREGNQAIFDNVFPKLRSLLNGPVLTGRAALRWDMNTLSEEQTLIQPLYRGVSADTRQQLDCIARQWGLPGAIAYVSPSASVPDSPHIRGGSIPPFTGTSLTSINERWLYGMLLGDRFTPGGTGFNPAVDRFPVAPAGYSDGGELALVRTRPNLHRLDAALDGGGAGATWVREEVEAILGRLTRAEMVELLRDRMPGGEPYSRRLPLSRPAVLEFLARWEIDLEAQMRFLSGCIGGENPGPWRELSYREIAPIIRPFSQAQKARLHTISWRRIFIFVCDDDSIADAATDLGLPPALRTQWIDEERSWF